MTTRYSLISEEIIIEGERKVVYGIEVAGESYTRIYNICADKEVLDDLICKCNALELSDVHILDVCDDFLVSNY